MKSKGRETKMRGKVARQIGSSGSPDSAECQTGGSCQNCQKHFKNCQPITDAGKCDGNQLDSAVIMRLQQHNIKRISVSKITALGALLFAGFSSPAQTNLFVAQDGSAQFKSVQAAIMSVPSASRENPAIIHI